MSEYFGLHFHLIVSDTMLEYIPFGGINSSAGERKVKERESMIEKMRCQRNKKTFSFHLCPYCGTEFPKHVMRIFNLTAAPGSSVSLARRVA